MISIYEKSNVRTKQGVEEKEIEFRGLSTDEKPTTIGDEPIANGTVFIEIDTQEVFIYDGENTTWLPESGSKSKAINNSETLNKEIMLEPIIETKKENEEIIEDIENPTNEK